MVRATVRLYGTLRYRLKQPAVTLELPSRFTLGDLLDALARQLGAQVKADLLSRVVDGYLQGHVQVFVGDRQAQGHLEEHFGPFHGPLPVEIFVVPIAEGGSVGLSSRRLQQTGQQQDGVRWIPSVCGMCYAHCSILAKVKQGVVVKIEGNPNSPVGAGKLCPKGVAGIMTLYDPHRLNAPLMRTNPEKGPGVDPGWKQISWEEASRIIVERLRRIRADDPRKLCLVRTTTTSATRVAALWLAAFGSPNGWAAGGGLHCGNGAHLLSGQFHASWSLVPDFSLCEFAIYFGASKGHAAGHSATANAALAADARARGMKIVVVDPMCNFAGAKATEWVPIRPGTDAALALGMVNVILNELGVWDAGYLKQHTNGVYLIGPDGLYVRDPDSGKPLVWDEPAGKPRPYDDPGLADPALLGHYEVRGIPCRPAFQLLKDHVRKYTPDVVERVTSVPAATVRRLAYEFATRARVGSTIELDGCRLPFRPVAAIYFRGAQGHKNSTWTCLAIELLNQIVGASDVPGGALGFNPVMHGHPDTGRPFYEPYAGPDGLMVVGTWVAIHKPYPPSDPKVGSLTMADAWPLTMMTGFLCARDQEQIWNAFNIRYRPEMLINIGANPVLTVGNPETAIEALKKIPFVVSFDLFLTEFSDLCDIVLPDASTYERLDAGPQWPPLHAHPAGPGLWGWAICQPLVEREGQRRDFQEVLLEWAYEVGFGDEYHALLNRYWGLTPEYALKPGERYTWEEICDRRLKSHFGQNRGLDWFREHGVLTWRKTVREVYWRPFIQARVPIYYETLKRVGQKQRELFEQFGFAQRIDWTRFEPLPDWAPCNSHQERRPEFDLWAFYYRDVLTTNSFTYENPWLDEVASANPYSFRIAMNPATAARKGLRNGDWVVLESPNGRKARGRLWLTQAIHPECVGVAGCGGHFTRYQPVAMGKGVRFNELLEIDFSNMDPVNLNLDLCVKVRVYRDPTARSGRGGGG